MTTTNEAPDVVYGRLLESAHLTGYTAERALSEFEWLLEEERWQAVGTGYDDIDLFLAAVAGHFDQFKLAVDQRKSIAKKLEGLQAAKRATARALGVSDTTVHRDLSTSVAPDLFEQPSDQALSEPASTSVAPDGEWFQRPDVVDQAKQTVVSERRKKEREAQYLSLIHI